MSKLKTNAYFKDIKKAIKLAKNKGELEHIYSTVKDHLKHFSPGQVNLIKELGKIKLSEL